MNKIKLYTNTGDIKTALDILIKEKGINLKFLCNKANVNYSLICKYKDNKIDNIGQDKKEALLKTIKELYL